MTIGNYLFDFVNNIEIISTWEELTDRVTITVPRKLRVKKDGLFSDAITSGPDAIWKRNDPVRIAAGYDLNHAELFTGFLTKISPKLPLQFQAEDRMFKLKQTVITKAVAKTISSTGNITLTRILELTIPQALRTELNFTVRNEDIQFGKFTLTQSVTVAELLDYFRKRFGLSCFFQDAVLSVGFAYNITSIGELDPTTLAEFKFQTNIIDDSNLDYIRDDDVKLKVIAISIKPDNTRTQIEVGDPEGELRTIYFYDVNTVTLTKLANEALEKLKYEGFRGSFTTFLQPTVKHGQAVKMTDPQIPDRNGIYLVKQVVSTIGVDGGRQEITLDRKIQ